MLIQSKVESGAWKTIHTPKGGLDLSHLLFADVVLLFCEANPNHVQVDMDTLDEFY